MQIINYPLVPRPRERNINDTPVELVGVERLEAFTQHLATADAVAVDTETHDKIMIGKINGAVRVISVATRHLTDTGPAYGCYVLDVRDLPQHLVASAMAAISTPAHGWNVNFDDQVLKLYDAPVAKWREGQYDEAIMWAGMPGRSWWLSLSEAARRYLDYDLDGKGSVQMSYTETVDLSVAQIDYAGRDALVTLYLSEIFAEMLAAQRLERTADLEQGQREFLVEMMANGIPFDRDGWMEYIESRKALLVPIYTSIAKIAASDKEVQSASIDDSKCIVASFADGSLRKLFNPDSDPQLREAFNLHESGPINKRFGRPMDRNDKLDAATLSELELQGSQLAPVVLAYRKISKEVTTYGEKFMRYVSEGRLRSRYKQAQTATGRLAADLPNPQNMPGESKRYTRPHSSRRMVQADYSQAELRCLAEMANEPAMLQPFFDGLDLHDETARQVFGIDLSELKKTDPEAAKKTRTKVKGVNFGIPYGMQAAALSRRLIQQGVLEGATQKQQAEAAREASQIIKKVMASRPKMAAWLEQRDTFVRRFAGNPGPVDWAASFKLLDTFNLFDAPRRSFKKKNRRFPSPMELVELVSPPPNLFDPGWDEQTMQSYAADIDWAFRYDAPVVLRPPVVENGRSFYEPVAFESRTKAGRRRIFAVVMDSGFQRSDDGDGHGGKKSEMFSGIVTAAMLIVATSDKDAACAHRDEWATANNISLPRGTTRCVRKSGESLKNFKVRARRVANEERVACVKAFDGDRRPKKLEFVRHICQTMGSENSSILLSMALNDAIGALGPAFRNHPIQGAVADITAAAFEPLMELKQEYPDLVWVQSVHDSIIGECDESNAKMVAVKLRVIMERAMQELFPNVPSKVDAEVCTDLSDAGVVLEITSEMTEAALQTA